MKETLVGSLTNYCFHHATVPVVSVPPPQRARVSDAEPPTPQKKAQ
jgi:hypothetical protein